MALESERIALVAVPDVKLDASRAAEGNVTGD
jgi:hypothetical protein